MMPEIPEIRDHEEYLSEKRKYLSEKRSRVLRLQAMLTYVILITALLIVFIFAIYDGKFFSFRLDGHSTKAAASSMMVMAVMLGAYFSSLTAFLQRLRRYRRYRAKISLTGQPGVGKTVFSFLLYHIITSYPPQGIEFTGETKNVIKVFRALRGFDLGEWPPSTSPEGVSIMEGKLSSGRHTYEISIADTAGEYWANLDEEKTSKHPYLTLIASSDILVHVISVPEIQESIELVEDDILDLQMAAQLMKGARDKVGNRIPLLVVFSKFDGRSVKSPTDEEILFKCFRSGEEKVLDQKIEESIALLEERLSTHFSLSYVLSSALEVRKRRLPSDLVLWVMRAARQ